MSRMLLPRRAFVGVVALCLLAGLGLAWLPRPAARALAGCGPAPGLGSHLPGSPGKPLGCGLAIPEAERADDLALLPAGVTGFVSVRSARLVEQLGLEPKGEAAGLFKTWQAGVGVPLSDVERFTVAATDLDGHKRLLVVLMRRPIDRDAVLKACAPDGTVRETKLEVHTCKKTGLAVHFAGKDLFVVADSFQTMKQCLAKPADVAAVGLKAALERAAKSDVTAWGAAKPPHAAPVTTYKPVHWLVRRQREQVKFLPFVPFPLPGGLESGALSFDLGDEQMLGLQLAFRDEPTAKRSVKMVRRLVDMCRCELLGLGADEAAEGEERPERPECFEQVAPLCRSLEKQLQKAAPKAEKSSVVVSVALPLKSSEARGAVVALAQQALGSEPTPGLFFRPGDDNSPRPVPMAVVPSPAPPPPPPTCPAPNAPSVYVVTPPPPPPPPFPPSPPGKLTVANVRKEAVVLFSVDAQGELSFVRKLPAGEAADVQTVLGTRWLAVFLSEPYRVKYVVSQYDAVWLLR